MTSALNSRTRTFTGNGFIVFNKESDTKFQTFRVFVTSLYIEKFIIIIIMVARLLHVLSMVLFQQMF